MTPSREPLEEPMPQTSTSPSIVRALKGPFRDILRGMTSVAGATEDMLHPAARALPGPLRDAVKQALRALEGQGDRLLTPDITQDDVRRAAAFLRGEAHGRGEAAGCARVLAFAWARLRSANPDYHHMLSETVAASRLVALRRGGPLGAADHAAHLFADLRGWHVAGHAPGLPVPLSQDEQDAVDLKLVAVMVWLLSERGADIAEESALLDMAMALARACRDSVLGAIGDPDRLARELKTLSDHL